MLILFWLYWFNLIVGFVKLISLDFAASFFLNALLNKFLINFQLIFVCSRPSLCHLITIISYFSNWHMWLYKVIIVEIIYNFSYMVKIDSGIPLLIFVILFLFNLEQYFFSLTFFNINNIVNFLFFFFSFVGYNKQW